MVVEQGRYSAPATLALADVIALVLRKRPDLSGVWQVSSEPISKFDLLEMVNREMNLGITLRRDEAFVSDRSLCSERFRRELGYTPPTWTEMIHDMAQDRTPYDLMRKGKDDPC